MTDRCLLCDQLNPSTPPRGGWVYRDQLWAVAGHPGIAVPGWLAMHTVRHVATLAELNVDEAHALGPLLRSACRWLQHASGAPRTYIYALGEGVRHVHILLGIPLSDTDTSLRGASLLTRILQRDSTLVDADRYVELIRETAQVAADDSPSDIPTTPQSRQPR